MKIQRQSEQFQVFSSETDEKPEELTGDNLLYSNEGKVDNITKAEVDSLGQYYGSDYREINGHLRGKEPYGDPELTKNIAESHIPHLDSLMDKVPEFTQPVLLHRGIIDPNSGFVTAGDKIFGKEGEKIGKVFKDKGYVSASSDNGQARSFGTTLLHIHAGPGTKALNETSRGGNYGAWEKEFTFPRNQRFKVLSDKSTIINDGREIRHIHLKALRPDEDTHLEHFSRWT